MATVYRRSDTGNGFSPRSRKRRVFVGNEDIGRLQQETAYLEAMGSPTTPNGTPLLERLIQLEQQMAGLEQKYSPRGLAADLRSPTSPSSLFSSPTTPSSLERRCRPVKSVLLETEAKGTLVERIQTLERRISQHSMDLEKAFQTIRFHSSRFEPQCGESQHLREEDSEHIESRDGSSQATPAHDDNLEVSSIASPPAEEHGKADLKQLTEDGAIRETQQRLEDEHLTPSPTEETQTGAVSERAAAPNECSEAEAAAKGMHDESAARESKLEADQKEDKRKDGGPVEEPSDLVKEPSSLSDTETDEKRNAQSMAVALVSAPLSDYVTQVSPLTKKELRRKHSFKHLRERIQRLFGYKEVSATETANKRPPRFSSI